MKDETCYLIEQLKEKRIEQGISQNKLAKETNMANTTVLRMENKTMDITLDKFISLANELGYSLKLVKKDDYFLDNRINVLKIIMDIRHINQNELANIINYNPSYINKIINGNKKLTWAEYSKISKALNVKEKDMEDIEKYYNFLDSNLTSEEKMRFTKLFALETILDTEHDFLDYNPKYKKLILK